jgi:hypothetical protein
MKDLIMKDLIMIMFNNERFHNERCGYIIIKLINTDAIIQINLRGHKFIFN